MSSERKHIYAILNSKYKPLPFCEQYVCFYCGEPADTLDHVPALYKAYCLGLDYLENNDVEMYLVPSCHECNSLLGARGHLCPRERKEELKTLLRKRYQKFLNLPDWSDDELDELGPTMRREVEDSFTIKKHVSRRLDW